MLNLSLDYSDQSGWGMAESLNGHNVLALHFEWFNKEYVTTPKKYKTDIV